MNIYWSVLNALHGGLAVWDVTQSLVKNKTPEMEAKLIRSLRFFNKYAGQVLPETSSHAFVAFHRGLDAEDTVTFPESRYGEAVKSNAKRYKKIVKDFRSFGAKMEDVEAAMVGQVASRKIKKGFNDSSWKIESGNYSRFINQIEPNKYDQAYWGIGTGGKYTTETPRQSRFARGFHVQSNKNAIYLDVDDKLAKANADKTAKISVTYFDDNSGEFSVYYDGLGKANKLMARVKLENTNTWITKTFEVADQNFTNSGPKNSDISLINSGNTDVKFHMVEIDY